MNLGHPILFLTLVVLVLTLRAGATDNPSTLTTSPGDRPFSFDPNSVSVECNNYYNSSRIAPVAAPGVFNTLKPVSGHDFGLEELLNLESSGYVVDPSILKLNLGLTLGADELWHREQATSGSEVLAVDDFNVAAVLFPKATSTINVDASRTTELTSQPFSETYRSITDHYDVAWKLPVNSFDTTVHLFEDDFSQHSPLGLDNFKYTQAGAGISSSGTIGPSQHLSFHDEFNEIRQTDALDRATAFNNDVAGLIHEIDFGPALKSSLTTSVNYLDQIGDFAQQRADLQEDLLLHHSEGFESFYQYELSNTVYPLVNTTLNRIQGGLRYTPLQDIHLVGTLGGLAQDQSRSETNEFYAHLDGDYSHPAPLGVVLFNLGLSLDEQYNQAQEVPAYVTTNLTFDAGQQIIIPRAGIRSNSVSVLNGTGSRAFINGFDYTVVYANNRAVIQRIVGGAILADSTVQVDYTVAPQPAHDVATDSGTIGLRYDFKESYLNGLSLYAHYFVQRQSISTDQPGAFIADNIDDLTYGIEYRVWRLRFMAETDDHHSQLFPFHSNHFSARYEDRIGPDLRLYLDATQVRSTFYDSKTQYQATSVSGNLNYRLARHLYTDLTLEQVNITGNAAGPSHGWDEQLSLKYERDLTTLKAGIRYSQISTQTLNSSNLYLFFGLERRF